MDNSQKTSGSKIEGKQKDLSIIIVNYKTPSMLGHCIDAIKASPTKASYEIIVLDNASEDETVEMLENDYPEVNLIASQENLGFPKAVNRGIKFSRGKYVLILNPDITLLRNPIDIMMEYLKSNPSVGVVGSKLVNPNGDVQNSCFATFTTPRIVLYRRTPLGRSNKAKLTINKFLMNGWNHDRKRQVAWLLGSCMMASRESINKVGLMDERFFMYMEDVDWCRRFWKAGLSVCYLPEASMVHYYQRESAPGTGLIKALFNKQTRIHIKSAFKFFLKYLNENDAHLSKQLNQHQSKVYEQAN